MSNNSNTKKTTRTRKTANIKANSTTKSKTLTSAKKPTLKQEVANLKEMLTNVNLENSKVQKSMAKEMSILRAEASNSRILLNSEKTKIQMIIAIILDRLDGDGKNDLEGLSGKLGWWFVLRNLSNIAAMLQSIINVIKGDVVEIVD